MKKIIKRFCIYILSLAILFFLALLFYKKTIVVNKESKYALVDKQLSMCQELVTAKYRYSDIVTLKKSLAISKSYSIVKYTGIIYVGIQDFTDISYSISLDGKTIKLKVPKVQMLSNTIVHQEVFDERQSIFVPITLQEVFDEIEVSMQETATDLLLDGVLEETQQYANFIISQFLYSCGFEHIEISNDL